MAKKHSVYLDKNNRPMTSVTTMMNLFANPGLVEWQMYVGKAKAQSTLEAAGRFGTLVHGAIQAIIEDGQVPYLEEGRTRTVIENLQKWIANNVDEWFCFEQAVYNYTKGYAGTFDAIVRLKNGQIMLLDFKTSKRIYPSYRLQMVAYAKAEVVENNTFDLTRLQGAILLHLNHETLTWEAVVVNTDDPELNRVWDLVTNLYPWWVKNYAN